MVTFIIHNPASTAVGLDNSTRASTANNRGRFNNLGVMKVRSAVTLMHGLAEFRTAV
jgi:hypothetical protein